MKIRARVNEPAIEAEWRVAGETEHTRRVQSGRARLRILVEDVIRPYGGAKMLTDFGAQLEVDQRRGIDAHVGRGRGSRLEDGARRHRL